MNFLDKYNPKINLFKEIDQELLIEDKPERAFKTWEMLLKFKKFNDASFLVIGKLLKDVRDDKLYEQLDYDNFSQFLASEELGFSREKAYMCIKTYEFYIEYLEMEPDKIGQMNISRLSMMVPMLKKIDDKTEAVKQIEEMNNLRHGDFVREVKQRASKDGKPTVYFSEELGKWYIGYHPDTCHLHDLGNFEKAEVV